MGAEPEVANSKVGERSLEISPGQAAARLNSLEDFLLGPRWGGAPKTRSLPVARLQEGAAGGEH